MTFFTKKLILSRREVIISQQQQTMCQVCSILKKWKEFYFLVFAFMTRLCIFISFLDINNRNKNSPQNSLLYDVEPPCILYASRDIFASFWKKSKIYQQHVWVLAREVSVSCHSHKKVRAKLLYLLCCWLWFWPFLRGGNLNLNWKKKRGWKAGFYSTGSFFPGREHFNYLINSPA